MDAELVLNLNQELLLALRLKLVVRFELELGMMLIYEQVLVVEFEMMEKKLVKAWKIIDHHLKQYILLKKDNLRKGDREIDMITSYMISQETALCESLRLYPPVPATHKGIEKEDVLPNVTMVKPGMMILISMYTTGRLEWVWGKDCLGYKLERRWINENGKLNPIPLTKFLTFLAGPRNCIGRDMAFTQMKLVIAAVLFNFHVELVEGHIVRPKASMVLHMQNGLKVRIRRRVSQATHAQSN
ncbi:hypothetical protein IFM89_030962 [Coptis chinensis]|uniref:Cytochrome P450 n=1 Tax=Coptis chinensis TaxID=261450 RepID=A0A835IYH1_9MAGN|nr:hypothetical protein IFM89_030962 [Coptis chinensis]